MIDETSRVYYNRIISSDSDNRIFNGYNRSCFEQIEERGKDYPVRFEYQTDILCLVCI